MTNKYRGFFLNIIYLVFLVEVALNRDNINYEEYVELYEATKDSNIKIKTELEDIEKKNYEYLQRINEKNIDFPHCSKIKNIIEKTKDFCNSIDETKEKLIKENGGYDKKNNIKNPKGKRTEGKTLGEINIILNGSYKEPSQEDNNNKKPAEENKKIENTSLKKEVKEKISLRGIKRKIRKKTKEKIIIPEEKEKENYKRKKEGNLKKKTLIELLAGLEQKKNEFLLACLMEINKIEKKIEENKWDVGSFDILIKPEKNIIKQNEQYRAQIFLVAKNTNEKIKVDDNEIKDNSIVLPPKQNVVFDNKGLSKQKLNVNYNFKSPFNNKTISLSKAVEFSISNGKDIEGQHALIEALYKNCDNLYSVRNLDPERNNDISFSFEGGSCNIIKKENDKFTLMLVPTEDKGILHILNAKKEIDKIEFNVREIGKPKIDVVVNNKIAVENSILTTENINNIMLTSTANESFKDKFPNESYYEVQNFTIYFCKDDKAFYTKEVGSDKHTLNAEEKRQLRKAEKMIIKTDSIKRLHIDPETKKEKTKEKNILSGGEVFSRTVTLISKEKDEEED